MEERIPTAQEISQTISAARDSVWVVNDEILKESISKNNVEWVKRNVEHLNIIMSDKHVIGSGEDLSDLTQAIQDGTTFLEFHAALLEE
jgi:ribonucleotide monophosphatase NagD (HAD superfamily)